MAEPPSLPERSSMLHDQARNIFVGRQKELAELRGALDDVLSGRDGSTLLAVDFDEEIGRQCFEPIGRFEFHGCPVAGHVPPFLAPKSRCPAAAVQAASHGRRRLECFGQNWIFRKYFEGLVDRTGIGIEPAVCSTIRIMAGSRCERLSAAGAIHRRTRHDCTPHMPDSWTPSGRPDAGGFAL